jgi:hypothetical protein
VRSTTNTVKMTPKRRAFHTEEVGFCCVEAGPLGGSSRDGEALCKGSDDVAAFDIFHSLLGHSKMLCYLIMPVCCLVRTSAVAWLSKSDVFG